jgi:hypothetical protein
LRVVNYRVVVELRFLTFVVNGFSFTLSRLPQRNASYMIWSVDVGTNAGLVRAIARETTAL